MESKKINQLATNVAPVASDLTIVGDPTTGVSKKVTLSQIASLFAGAVDFYTNLAAFPATGVLNTIYCAKDTQKLYLWSGSAYVETFPSQSVLNTYQLLSAKGVANGYASLDASGKVPIGELPSSIMEYKGLWSAATNTPTLANGTGDTGDVYICSAAGSVNFGAGAITFAVGDYVIYSGSIWQRSSGAVGTVTSVGLSTNAGAITIGSSPITTSGTITANFNGTNLQYVNGAGNLTTFPTLITSIGLSMPSAFSVANSPLTANGTIAVTGAGVASQYIRGDGTLANFPTSGGGGSSVAYYFNSSVSQGTLGGVAYRELSKVPIIGAGTDITIATNGYIANYITDAGDPSLLEIPAGNWNFEMFFSASSNGGSPSFYVELYKYDGTTFTLISSSSATPEGITNGTAIDLYTTALAVPLTTLTLTDRLAIRVYVNNSGRTITLHTENSHLCEVITTFSTGIAALNGLTAQVQYFQTGTSGTDFNISSTTATHTFNIPDASATARGLITTGTQTIAGTKTFSDATKNNGGIFLQNASSSSLAGYMNLGGLTNGVKFTSGGGVSNTFTLPSATGYTFTFPNATGTIALTSDISYPVTSVFGRTGSVVATSGDYTTAQVTESGNLYFTDSRARLALSFVAGSGAYNSTTGVITIPTNNNQITNGSNYITLASLSAGVGISYNNTTGVITNSAPDQVVALTASTGISVTGTYPNFTITNTSPSSGGTVTSVAALTIGTSGTDLSSSVANSTTTPVITLNVPTASATNRGALSSADWTTFNNKQGTITLTTTGTSGAATFSANTLNIPNYGSALTSYVPYTGATTSVNLGAFDLTATTITATTLTDGIINISSAQINRSAGNVELQYAGSGGVRFFGNTAYPISFASTTGNATFTGTIAASNFSGSSSGTNTGDQTLASLGAQPQLNGTGFVKASGTTISYDNSTYLTTTSASSTYVPYTGANANVNIGAYGITAGSLTDGFITMASAQINRTGFFVEMQYNAVGGVQFFGNTANAIVFASATGAASFSSSVQVGTGTYTSGVAKLYTTSTYGTILTGISGSSSDMLLTDRSGNIALQIVANSTTPNIVIGNNLGLGVTPNATASAYKALQLGTVGNWWGGTGAASQDWYLSNNSYYNGTALKAIILGPATEYAQVAGVHRWSSAASVGAGATQAMNPIMVLNASGNLSIGNASDSYKLDVSGTIRILSSSLGLTIDGGTGALDRGVITTHVNRLDQLALCRATVGTFGIQITTGNVAVLSAYDSSISMLQLNMSTYVATFYSSVYATGFFESSDSRLKTLIQDNYQTKGIESITPKLYTKNGKVELGYYAQDLVGVLDSAVSKGGDDMLCLSYREVHTAKIYALEQRIKELESKLN